MKIREIRVQDFRNFGPELRSVKFYDEATGLVRPISVLVGSNGCGKTTLLELIMSLLESAAGMEPPGDSDSTLVALASGIARGLRRASGEPSGLAYSALRAGARVIAEVEFDLPVVPTVMRVGVLPKVGEENIEIVWTGTSQRSNREVSLGLRSLRESIDAMEREGPLRGGAIFLPHNRWIAHEQKGAISPPEAKRQWVHRFSQKDRWEGSLAQLWVWQNYLDLEQGHEGRPNLAPFVETIEEIFGRDRKIKIQQGRVRIERPDRGDSVEPHELPSGEQQILTIFGELARMLRPGGVILIDEVEISLHPALQRAVLFHLRRLAAKYDLQVILTTHSMEIVSSVAPEEVINLDDMAVVEQSQAQGKA